MSAMLRCLIVCLSVRHENMASETTRLGFEKCKMQKPSILLLDFAEIFGVHWTLTLA